jgi:hypothetical protein
MIRKFIPQIKAYRAALVPYSGEAATDCRCPFPPSLAKVICVQWTRGKKLSVRGLPGAVHAVYENSDHARLGEGGFGAL